MTQPFLSLPNLRYQSSFLQALAEYQAEGLPYYSKLNKAELESDFAGYVTGLQAESRGENLPAGRVPHTIFWLVKDDDYLGRVDIRHDLNEYLSTEGGHLGYDIRPSQRGKGYGKLILELGLQKAKELGLPKILITCDIDNLPSKKIIEANGGVLEKIAPVGAGKTDKAFYWIKTT